MNEILHYHHQQEFRVTGISRSGNHAIINWILGHLQDKTYCFLNCAEPKFNPFKTCRPLGANEKCWETNIPDFDIEKEINGNFSKKDYLLFSHEDSFLGPLVHRDFRENRERWLGRPAHRKDILIIRDPFNLFASRRRAGFLLGYENNFKLRPMSAHSLRRIYKQHAKEVLGRSNFLKNKLVIHFNRWVKDPEYRRDIATALELDHTDEGMRQVSRVAGGSSFDGTSIATEELHPKLEVRWKNYAADPAFRQIFDEELIDLSSQIFGETEAVKAFSRKAAEKKTAHYSF